VTAPNHSGSPRSYPGRTDKTAASEEADPGPQRVGAAGNWALRFSGRGNNSFDATDPDRLFARIMVGFRLLFQM
jgi:hypothetical protein